MPAENIIERSFSGGEVAPALYARVDHTKYTTGLRTCRNMFCMRHGGVTQRPGTMFVGATQNGGNPVRLIPFIFNETGIGQSYVLEFGNLYIAFYQNGGVVLSGGVPYQIPSPYAQADLATLRFSESADVVTITHLNYPIQELRRLAPTNWTLTPIVFGSGFPSPLNVVASGGGVGTLTFSWVVTPVSATGDEQESDVAGGASVVNVNTLSQTNPINLTWNALPGVIVYKVYKNLGGTLGVGYIGTATSNGFTDTGINPDFTNQPPRFSAFEIGQTPGNYPSVCGFVQQRRVFANTLNNPIGVWASREGSFSNFSIHVVGTSPDDDPLTFSIASEEVNAIQAVFELKFMLALTTGTEIFVQGNGNGVVTPSSINATVQSYYGANALRPIKIGEVCLYLQSLGNFIRDLVFDFVIDGYRGNDITVFSAHLFEGHQIVDWCYQKIPDSIVWAVRDDGILLSLTYVREQQILAWTRHDFTNGFVENVVSIPENGNYAVYAVIRRVINGTTVRYLERLSSRIWTGPSLAIANGTANASSDPIDGTYLDCFSLYDGRNGTALTMTLTASGGFQSGTGTEYQQLLTLTSSAGYFGPGSTAQVGDEIFIQDALFISSQGSQGNQLRCTIQATPNLTVAKVTPNRAVPAEFQGIPTTNWSRAVNTLSGLGYLAGQQVSVWADRFVVGSPLNQDLSTVYTVSLTGSITLDQCYAVIYVGLPMTVDFETLGIDTTFGDAIMDEPKDISQLSVYLYNSRGFFGGTRNPDLDPDNIVNGVVQNPLFNLFENKGQENRQTYDAPPGLLTTPVYTNINCDWAKEGRIFIRNVDPIPLSILAVIPAGLTSAKVAWSQKV